MVYSISPSFTLLLALCLSSLSNSAIAAVPQDAEGFKDDLAQVHKYMEQERWDKAKSALDQLLVDHEKQSYVIAQRVLLLEDAERIAFWQQTEKPELQSLIHGELKSWKPGTTSRIDLRYELGFPTDDFDVDKYLVLHPIVFAGPYEVEVAGSSFPWDKSRPLNLCKAGDTQYLAFLGVPQVGNGRYFKARLYREVDDVREKLDEFTSIPVKAGEPYKAWARISDKKITVKLNGKKILEAKRDSNDEFGQFGFHRALLDGGITSIRIKGEITSSWASGIIDAAMVEQRTEFASSYEPEEVLPSWLVQAATTRASSTALRSFPKPSLESVHQAWEIVPAAIESGQATGALEWLTSLPEDAIPPSHRAYLSCLLYEELGRLTEALAACQQVLKLDNLFLPARMKEASFIEIFNQRDAAELFERIATDFPNSGRAVRGFIEMLLRTGQMREARQWLDVFLTKHPTSEGAASAQRLLIKAENGPTLASPTRYATEHYEVVTDLDRDACIDIAQRLERIHRAYKLHLRHDPGREVDRFKVFLFSGEAGFSEYSGDILGGWRPSTAGIYSPVVRQLLIWNLPDRSKMLQSIQHEAFHQYLDHMMPNPPVWLNESMASYFELAGFEQGKWDEGQPDRSRINVLRAEGMIPLRDFMNYSDRQFRARGSEFLNYSQGWLFVHYMRNSSAENRQRFDRLLDALCDQENGHQAIRQFMQDEDIAAIEQGMKDHLKSLYSDD